jgi:hypothetical protein
VPLGLFPTLSILMARDKSMAVPSARAWFGGYGSGVARYELRQESGCEFLAWPEVSDKSSADTVVVNSRTDLVALQQAGHVVTLDEVTQSLFDDCFPLD